MVGVKHSYYVLKKNFLSGGWGHLMNKIVEKEALKHYGIRWKFWEMCGLKKLSNWLIGKFSKCCKK